MSNREFYENASEEDLEKWASEFEGMAEMTAYLFRTEGEAPLRAVLDEMQSSPDHPNYQYREDLEEQAAEIAKTGITKCAALVLEYAEQAIEARYQCPIPPRAYLRLGIRGPPRQSRRALQNRQGLVAKPAAKIPRL
jgi:hypothetical protein